MSESTEQHEGSTTTPLEDVEEALKDVIDRNWESISSIWVCSTG